jgi:endonuclease/exonuclease/phosphatase family metal-dependent hydrolase
MTEILHNQQDQERSFRENLVRRLGIMSISLLALVGASAFKQARDIDYHPETIVLDPIEEVTSTQWVDDEKILNMNIRKGEMDDGTSNKEEVSNLIKRIKPNKAILTETKFDDIWYLQRSMPTAYAVFDFTSIKPVVEFDSFSDIPRISAKRFGTLALIDSRYVTDELTVDSADLPRPDETLSGRSISVIHTGLEDIVMTHLEARNGRVRDLQAEFASDYINDNRDEDADLYSAGDLNAGISSFAVEELRQDDQLKSLCGTSTIEGSEERIQIDHVFVPLNTEFSWSCFVSKEDSELSDHKYMLVKGKRRIPDQQTIPSRGGVRAA